MDFGFILESFFKFYYAPILLLLGFIGNTIVILVFRSKNIRKLSFSKFVMFMTISDTMGLIVILEKFLNDISFISMRNISDFSCQFFVYLAYAFNPISAWLMAYISFERFISIRFPTKSLSLKKESIQNIIILSVYLFNFVINLPFLILAKLNEMESENGTYCDLPSTKAADIMIVIDLFNSTVLPFILMFLNTILLSYTIFKSRSRTVSKSKLYKKDNQRKKKDFKFVFTSICLNLSFLLLNLPLLIAEFVDGLLVVSRLYFANFAIQFFIHYISNSLFRSEFKKLFKIQQFVKSHQDLELGTKRTIVKSR